MLPSVAAAFGWDAGHTDLADEGYWQGNALLALAREVIAGDLYEGATPVWTVDEVLRVDTIAQEEMWWAF